MTIKDHFFTGLLSGLIAPLIAFSTYTKLMLPEETIVGVFHRVTQLGIVSTIISISVFVNLLVFFIFIWWKSDRSAKGVLAATFLYAFLVAIIKITS